MNQSSIRHEVADAAEQTPSPAPNDPYEAFTSLRYFSGLDGLRAISVIAVIWTHVTGPHLLGLLNQGRKGVDLFFAISGFLVTTLLLREYRRNGRISLRDFFIRRTLRIFPLYYAVLGLYCILVFLTLGGTAKAAEFWQNLPAFASYTTNWFVTGTNSADHGVTFYFSWSLATEEQFYLFWPPLLVLLLYKSKIDWLPALVAMILLAIQIAAASSGSSSLAVIIAANMAPGILFGVAFAVLLNNREIFGTLWPVLGHKLMAPATALLLLLLLQLDVSWNLERFVMALLVASICVRDDTPLHPFLAWRPVAYVGMISYGIYLMHMLAANAVRKLVGQDTGLIVFVATVALVTLMAHLSFRYYEAPILRLKARFGSGSREPAVPDLPRSAITPS